MFVALTSIYKMATKGFALIDFIAEAGTNF